MNEPDTHRTADTCENCVTVLVGGYCHVCGQRAHNPLSSFSHALEEVFESFWHLDGRIFTTIRDLFFPGRLANSYLNGQRVKYVAPLRLFIILSLLTFFVGKLTLHLEPGSVKAGEAEQNSTIEFGRQELTTAKTVEEVIKARDAALAEIRETRQDPLGSQIVSAFANDAEDIVRKRARQRLIELHATPEQLRDAGMVSAGGAAPAATPEKPEQGIFARWANHKLQRIRENALVVKKDPDTLVKLTLGAVPGALLMLLPVFALCLKILYIRSGRGYLEHLVVALYSHAFMLTGLLGAFLMIGLQTLSGNSTLAFAIGSAGSSFILGLVIPLYLLLMQKRVYAQGWIKTLVKFTLLGFVYSVLLVMALLYAVFAGLSS